MIIHSILAPGYDEVYRPSMLILFFIFAYNVNFILFGCFFLFKGARHCISFLVFSEKRKNEMSLKPILISGVMTMQFFNWLRKRYFPASEKLLDLHSPLYAAKTRGPNSLSIPFEISFFFHIQLPFIENLFFASEHFRVFL